MTSQVYIKFQIGEYSSSHIFLVIPQLSVDIVLGDDWHWQHKLVLDYSESRIFLGGSLVEDSSVTFRRNSCDRVNTITENEVTYVCVIGARWEEALERERVLSMGLEKEKETVNFVERDNVESYRLEIMIESEISKSSEENSANIVCNDKWDKGCCVEIASTDNSESWNNVNVNQIEIINNDNVESDSSRILRNSDHSKSSEENIVDIACDDKCDKECCVEIAFTDSSDSRNNVHIDPIVIINNDNVETDNSESENDFNEIESETVYNEINDCEMEITNPVRMIMEMKTIIMKLKNMILPMISLMMRYLIIVLKLYDPVRKRLGLTGGKFLRKIV